MSEPMTPDATDDIASMGDDDWLQDVSENETEDQDNNLVDETNTKENAERESPSADEDAPAENSDAPAEDQASDEAAAAEAQKRHNNEMAQQRIAEKQALQANAQRFIDEANSAVDQYEDDDVRRELAEIKAKEAQRDATDFVRGVEYNQSVMSNDHARAVNEISMFRETNSDGSPNPEFIPGAYDRALTHIAPYIVTENVQGADGSTHQVILGSQFSVYDLLKGEADSLQSLLQTERSNAAIKGQQAELRMRGSAEPGASGSPPTKSGADKEADEMKAAFNLP